MEKEKELTQNLLMLSRLKNISLNVGEHLFRCLSKHIRQLKCLDNSIRNRDEWIEQAIKEKLDNDKNVDLDQSLKQKTISLKVSPEVFEDLEKRVALIRKFRRSYSKKQWLVDAIYEKLDRDMQRIKAFVEEKINNA